MLPFEGRSAKPAKHEPIRVPAQCPYGGTLASMTTTLATMLRSCRTTDLFLQKLYSNLQKSHTACGVHSQTLLFGGNLAVFQ